MATQRVYICPEHPDKVYTSWRKFRGHWSTKHRGEECPPKEEFLQEREKEEVKESKKERREALKEAAEAGETPGIGEGPEQFMLPDEPVPRLSKILAVHGVPEEIITQVLGVFQIHPAYRENPVNLHYLLTAKLPRKLHPSIPMIISAFTTQESYYPEGGMIGMIPGMGGPQVMPPYMMGGGYPPYYPPTYGLQPFYRPPMGGRVAPEEGAERIREKERNPIQDAVALLGTIVDLKDKLLESKGEGGSSQVQEIFEGFRATIEEIGKDSKEIQEKLLERIERVEESAKKAQDDMKEQFHKSEKDRLQDRISALETAKDEERSAGLGELLREAGEGVGAQLEGVRSSVNEGVSKLGTLAEKVVSVEGLPKGPAIRRGKGGVEVSRTVSEATGLLEVEEEVESLAKALEGG